MNLPLVDELLAAQTCSDCNILGFHAKLLDKEIYLSGAAFLDHDDNLRQDPTLPTALLGNNQSVISPRNPRELLDAGIVSDVLKKTLSQLDPHSREFQNNQSTMKCLGEATEIVELTAWHTLGINPCARTPPDIMHVIKNVKCEHCQTAQCQTAQWDQ